MQEYITLYGVLKKEFGIIQELTAGNDIEFIQTCLIPGILYDFGSFPGLKLDDNEVVLGEMYRVTSQETLNTLDKFEGFHKSEDTNLFLRKEIMLISPNVKSWIYEYNLDTYAGKVIGDGIFRN